MMTRPHESNSPLADESGVTLIELLIAMIMTVIITGAAVSMLVSSMHRQSESTQRADQIGTARNAIEKITADIRQGAKAELSGTNTVKLTTYCHSSTGTSRCEVTYTCSEEAGTAPPRYECTRKVGTKAARTVVTGLETNQVFSGDGRSEPRYVGVKVQLPTPGELSSTVLEDGAALHNATNYRGS
jgi:Tfp pilus assembly protein PilV